MQGDLPIPFSKYSGCGNDFILIDNRLLNLCLTPASIAKLCHRRCGIGADGVIFLNQSSTCNYQMRIFNADGSEAEMCGNGLRCLAHFIHSRDRTESHFCIETVLRHLVEISVHRNLVTVQLPSPDAVECCKSITVDEEKICLHFLDTGVPHAVLFVDDIEEERRFSLAPRIRFHQAFRPRGANVNFAKILDDHSIAVRTYERGVEQETLACGTGAAAVALAAVAVHKISAPVTIRTRSQDCLSIDFRGTLPHVTQLTMTGPAVKVYDGEFQLQSTALIE